MLGLSQFFAAKYPERVARLKGMACLFVTDVRDNGGFPDAAIGSLSPNCFQLAWRILFQSVIDEFNPNRDEKDEGAAVLFVDVLAMSLPIPVRCLRDELSISTCCAVMDIR